MRRGFGPLSVGEASALHPWTDTVAQALTSPTTALLSASNFLFPPPSSFSSSHINPGSGSRYRPTSLLSRPFLSLTRSILDMTQTILIPRDNIQLMADMTPAKNLDLSCINWLSMRYVADTLKLSEVERYDASRGKRGI